MTRMTGPDCAVMCNLIVHTRTHTHTRPMASALLQELKIMPTEVQRSQIEDEGGRFVGSPGGGRRSSREKDREYSGWSGSRRRKGAAGDGGGESNGKGQGSAEKGAIAFVKCLGVSQEERVDISL